MTRKRLLIGTGVLAAIFASAGTYKYFTGECPLAGLCRMMHGNTATPTKSSS